MTSGTGKDATLVSATERLEIMVRELQGMLGLAETLRGEEANQVKHPSPAERKVFTVTHQILCILSWVEEIHKVVQSLLGAIGD